MRIAPITAIALIAVASASCGPVDTSSSDGVAVSPDAGPVWTGGTDGGSGGGDGSMYM